MAIGWRGHQVLVKDLANAPAFSTRQAFTENVHHFFQALGNGGAAIADARASHGCLCSLSAYAGNMAYIFDKRVQER